MARITQVWMEYVVNVNNWAMLFFLQIHQTGPAHPTGALPFAYTRPAATEEKDTAHHAQREGLGSSTTCRLMFTTFPSLLSDTDTYVSSVSLPFG
jgi:hypothetical protein